MWWVEDLENEQTVESDKLRNFELLQCYLFESHGHLLQFGYPFFSGFLKHLLIQIMGLSFMFREFRNKKILQFVPFRTLSFSENVVVSAGREKDTIFV